MVTFGDERGTPVGEDVVPFSAIGGFREEFSDPDARPKVWETSTREGAERYQQNVSQKNKATSGDFSNSELLKITDKADMSDPIGKAARTQIAERLGVTPDALDEYEQSLKPEEKKKWYSFLGFGKKEETPKAQPQKSDYVLPDSQSANPLMQLDTNQRSAFIRRSVERIKNARGNLSEKDGNVRRAMIDFARANPDDPDAALINNAFKNFLGNNNGY